MTATDTPHGAVGASEAGAVSDGAAPDLTDLELAEIRAQFPILHRTVRDGQPLVYLDNGATSQKPETVLAAERDFYTRLNSAPHRGAHALSEEATEAYEDARIRIAAFIGATPETIVFTKSATESLNLVAQAMLASPHPGIPGSERFAIGPGDEILVTELEHHANLVPWQEVARRSGATLRWIPLAADGTLDLSDLDRLVTPQTKVVALAHVSNVLGTLLPLERIIPAARAVGATIVLDACQSVPHLPVDVGSLDVDFVAFSGHKMYGPMGIGILWGRPEMLAALPPFLTGGSMIEVVHMEGSSYMPPPARFEAGVPAAAQAVGLAAATSFLDSIGMDRLHGHAQALTGRLLGGLLERPWVRVLGPTDGRERGGAVAFEVPGVHAHDVGQVLDASGVAVRVGHHCAWPLHRALECRASVRASVGVYTTPGEIDALLEALDRVPGIFGIEGV